MKQPDPPATIEIAGQSLSNRVVSPIKAASHDTGVNFSYLMAQARNESAFKTGVKSSASSAAGLFQFTKGTWLEMIKRHGAAHGLGRFADQIQTDAKGEYGIADPAARKAILDLRRDPATAALMAGEYAKDNKAWLEKALGRPVDSTDLYMAHFLGPGGAARILKARAKDPAQPASALVPEAASKNQSVFYDKNQSPKSVAAVYERIRHAIEKPMRQYAAIETARETGGIGAANPAHPHRTAVAQAAPDVAWPFETGQWPPAYVPHLAAPESAPAATAQAFTDSSQSADQISSAMPLAETVPEEGAASPVLKVLKGLFG